MDSGEAAEVEGKTYSYDGTDAFGLDSALLATDGACDKVSLLPRVITPPEVIDSPRPTKRTLSSIDNDLEHNVESVIESAGKDRDSATSSAKERPRAMIKLIDATTKERKTRNQHAKAKAVFGAATRKVTGACSGYSPSVQPAPAVHRRQEAMPQPAAESAPKSALEFPSASISGMVVKLEKENEALKAEVSAYKLNKDSQ